MNMKRREMLMSTAVLGCGCLNTASNSPPSGRRLTNVTVTCLESAPISITPTVTRASITQDQTAQLELTVRGQGKKRTEVLFGNAIPFSSDQRSKPDGTLLLPASQNFGRKNQQTWLPAPGEDIIGPGGVVGRKFKSGETVTTNWSVWGDPDHVEYIEPGTYEFENSVTVESTDDQIPWTLTITIATETPD